MNGIPKKELLANLEKIRKSLCTYLGSRCDCKYMSKSQEKPSRGEDGPGCCELYEAIALITALDDDEFNKIRRRGKISIFELDQKDQDDLEQAINKIKNRKRIKKV